MRISSITKNAGKACNNRLYRHIRTFEKIVKNYFVIYSKYENLFVRMKLREDENKEIQSKHRRLILIACKLSVHKVMLFQEKYWNKVYKKMSMKEFEKIIEEFKNECNSER